MKILFVAVFNPNSTNVSQSDGFKKNGCEVIEFNYRVIAGKIGNHKRDRQLVEICERERPDAVVFSKCNEINPTIVDECNKYSKTVLWYMDPVNSNFSQSLIEKIKRSDLVFCSIWDSYLKAKEIGGDKVSFLHEGYDHLMNYPIPNLPIKYDVCFIGALRNRRYDYYNVYNFPLVQDAYGLKHSETVCQTRINLNFTEGGTSDRSYKVLASRGFLLTEPWPKMEEDFTIGKDLDIFTNTKEFVDKISYYLKNVKERNEIANHGHETVQKFDRINWAKKIMDELNNL